MRKGGSWRCRGRGRARAARAVASQRGFTIIEMVVSLTVLAAIMLALASVLGSGLKLVGSNKARVIAANLASQEMERVRSTDFALVPLGLTTVSENVDGTVYVVAREIQWRDQSSAAGPCDSPTASQDYLQVDVSVTWPTIGTIAPVESHTVLTPSAGSSDPTKGNVAVEVLDSLAAGSSGQTVTVTGTGYTATQVTPSSGCAFFRQLTPGTYTVSLSRGGYVDGQGNPAPSQTVGVVADEQVGVPFDYDQAGSLTVTAQAAGAAVPIDLPMTVGNTALVPLGTRTFSASGNPKTLSGLFPWSSGYAVWAGSCPDADPEGVHPATDARIYPSAQRGTAIAVPAGGSASATVDLPAVNIDVVRAGVPVGGATVVAQHADSTICPGGATLNLGLTGADGRLQVAMPYGSWSLTVNGNTPVGSWPVIALDPSETSDAAVVTIQ